MAARGEFPGLCAGARCGARLQRNSHDADRSRRDLLWLVRSTPCEACRTGKVRGKRLCKVAICGARIILTAQFSEISTDGATTRCRRKDSPPTSDWRRRKDSPPTSAEAVVTDIGSESINRQLIREEPIMSRFSVSSIVVLLVGAALGYVAASGGPISLFAARAASDGAVAPAGTDSAAEPTGCQEEGESCCTEGLGRKRICRAGEPIRSGYDGFHTADGRRGQKAEHSRHLGRRHRHDEHQRVQ